MKQIYPDGSWVELGNGDTYPPGHVGQHTSMNETWVRRDGGEWIPMRGVRSTHHARTLMSAGENATEVMEALVDQHDS